MYKKKITSLLAVVLLNLVGCYTPQMITKEEFQKGPEYPDLEVHFPYDSVYQFDEGDYIVTADSVYGKGTIKSKLGRKVVYEDYEGGVSIAGAEKIRIDKFDALAIVILIVAILGLGAAISALGEEAQEEIREQL